MGLIENFFNNDVRLTLVTAIEGNANWVLCNRIAAQVDDMMGRFAPHSPRPLHMINVDKVKKLTFYGVLTTDHAKECMVTTTHFYLSLRKIALDEKFSTAHPKGVRGVCDLLVKELGQMRRIHNEKTSRYRITGKGDENHDNDDLGMAFLMGVYWARRHLMEGTPAIEYAANHSAAINLCA